QAFYDGLSMYLYDMDKTESAYLAAVAYLEDVDSFAPDPFIKQSIHYEIGSICEKSLGKLSGLSSARREEYYLKAAAAYRHQLDNFSDTQDLEINKKPDNVQIQLGNTWFRLGLLGINDQKTEQYYENALQVYLQNLEEFPKPATQVMGALSYGFLRGFVAESYWKLAEIKSLSDEKRIAHYQEAGIQYLRAAREHPDQVRSPDYYSKAGSIYTGMSIGSLLSLLPTLEEKDHYCLLGIDAYREMRSKYPDYAASGSMLIQIANSFHQMSRNYGPTAHESNYRMEYVLQSGESYAMYLIEYPTGRDYMRCAFDASFRYSEAAAICRKNKDMAGVEKYYLLANDFLRKVLAMAGIKELYWMQAQYYIGENLKLLSDCYRTIARDRQKQRETGLKAIEEMHKMLEYSPSNFGYLRFAAASLRYIGEVHLHLEEYDKAIEYFDRCMETYPTALDFPYCLVGKGDALCGKKEYVSAEEWYRKIFDLTLSDVNKPYLLLRANRGLGLCALGKEEGNYHQTAHQYFAAAAAAYCDSITIDDGDDYALEVKELLITRVLRVSITPIVDDMPIGSSEVFTARIVYADSDETPAHIPQPSSGDWKWECTGTQGVDFNLDPMGNEARYTHLSGDFMDRIITAKCKIDAGIFTGKRSGKSVDKYVWVEGDNQVPVCLVNEDFKRLKYLPMHVPDTNPHDGMPVFPESQFGLSVFFTGPYSNDSLCQIEVIYISDQSSIAYHISMAESWREKGLFVAQNGWQLRVITPSTTGGYPTQPAGFEPGNTEMTVAFTGDGHAETGLAIPIWQWQSQAIISKQRLDSFFFASNRYCPEENVTDIDNDKANAKKVRFYVQIYDDKITGDAVEAKLSSKDLDSIDGIACQKVSGHLYRSKEMFVAVPWDFSRSTVQLEDQEYRALKVHPMATDHFTPDIAVSYSVSTREEQKTSNTSQSNGIILLVHGFSDYSGENLDEIRKTLENYKFSEVTILKFPTEKTLFKEMRYCKIFYFQGHSCEEELNANFKRYLGYMCYFDGWFWNYNGLIWPDNINITIDSLDMVFINSCHSGYLPVNEQILGELCGGHGQVNQVVVLRKFLRKYGIPLNLPAPGQDYTIPPPVPEDPDEVFDYPSSAMRVYLGWRGIINPTGLLKMAEYFFAKLAEGPDAWDAKNYAIPKAHDWSPHDRLISIDTINTDNFYMSGKKHYTLTGSKNQ
ncbi:MAG: tetratricopeptide repeat protein, partial [Candidatus Wallbacteria bacterium]|nr:tetratricopeptide repeat protein [Candidatus Wallbacteria bacterium]